MNKIMIIFGKFIPGHIKDPGLLLRMITSRDYAAWYTIMVAIAGFVLTPFDFLFQKIEKRYRVAASSSTLPIVIICGAPRTGTTLVSQILTKYLPVAYFNNLTALFPRSPITIYRFFSRRLAKRINFHSYYGKTQSLSGPNDAFFIWNEWMKEDQSGIRCVLREDKINDMRNFFGAFESVSNKPLIMKNNSLNTQAVAIAKAMPNAYFICMTRESEYVAQSLLKARMDIQGDIRQSIWADNPNKSAVDRNNYIEDVCDQVLYHEKKIVEQQETIGKERFWIISYEEFCRNPKKLVMNVGKKLLKLPDEITDSIEIAPIEVLNNVRVEQGVFDEIKSTIHRLHRNLDNSRKKINNEMS